MDIVIDPRGPATAVVQLSGKFDLVTSIDFKWQILDALATGRRFMVIDLGNVTFIDSSGLGALVAGLKATRQAGGDMRIARANEQALTVLRLTTLDRVLRPHATLDDALAGYDA
jgi:anti-sigma B factor antagonist